MEHPTLEWAARLSYLIAKNEVRQYENYVADLVWSIASRNLQQEPPLPSEIWNGKNKVDRRSGKQIVNDLIKKLGGE